MFQHSYFTLIPLTHVGNYCHTENKAYNTPISKVFLGYWIRINAASVI